MFGGAGIYRDGLMFGLVSGGELFLKTDELTAPQFIAAGSRPFTYEKKGRAVEMSYFSVPDEALDDPDRVAEWVELACAAARRAGSPRPGR